MTKDYNIFLTDENKALQNI